MLKGTLHAGWDLMGLDKMSIRVELGMRTGCLILALPYCPDLTRTSISYPFITHSVNVQSMVLHICCYSNKYVFTVQSCRACHNDKFSTGQDQKSDKIGKMIGKTVVHLCLSTACSYIHHHKWKSHTVSVFIQGFCNSPPLMCVITLLCMNIFLFWCAFH